MLSNAKKCCQAQLKLQLQLELSKALNSNNTPTHPTEKVVNSKQFISVLQAIQMSIYNSWKI